MRVQKSIILRMVYFLLLGILLAGIFSEVAFRLQGNTYSRDTRTIELVIPAGTSTNVAQGKSLIPTNQDFVVGDLLVIKNEDSVTQSLGPLVIPPGSTASMKLDQVGTMSYTCSFQPTQVYGIVVQPSITIWMRVQAALLAGIPLGLLVGVYSLVVKPVKPKPLSTQA